MAKDQTPFSFYRIWKVVECDQAAGEECRLAQLELVAATPMGMVL